MLVAALVGVAIAFVSGMALVPRVKLVEVFTVVASAMGAGAALTAAITAFKRARGGRT